MIRCYLFVLFLSLTFTVWAQSKKSVFPYRVVSGKMVVEVEINGKIAPLIFDTGGTMGIIDSECEKYGLQEDRTLMIKDVSGKAITYDKMKASCMKLPGGDMVYENFQVMKIKTPSPVTVFGTVGLLGSDLLGNSIVEIDHKKKLITITTSEEPVDEDIRYMLPYVDKSRPWPVVAVKVGKRDLDIMFDSGAYYLLNLREADYRDLYSYNETKLLERGFGRGPMGVSGTYIPRVEKRRVLLSPLYLGNTIFENIIIQELTTAECALFGLPMLEYGKVIIDYSRRQFYFVPYREKTRVKNELYNFHCHRVSDNLVIESIWGELTQKLRIGDKVLRINGKDIEQFDKSELAMKGIPAVTKKKKNKVTFMTRKGEVSVWLEKVIID